MFKGTMIFHHLSSHLWAQHGYSVSRDANDCKIDWMHRPCHFRAPLCQPSDTQEVYPVFARSAPYHRQTNWSFFDSVDQPHVKVRSTMLICFHFSPLELHENRTTTTLTRIYCVLFIIRFWKSWSYYWTHNLFSVLYHITPTEDSILWLFASPCHEIKGPTIYDDVYDKMLMWEDQPFVLHRQQSFGCYEIIKMIELDVSIYILCTLHIVSLSSTKQWSPLVLFASLDSQANTYSSNWPHHSHCRCRKLLTPLH